VNGWVAERVNAALEPTFKGRLVLRRLGHLDFGGLSDAEIEVFDPAGKSVLMARDIDVRLFWPGVAWQAVVQQPEVLRVPIGRVELDEVDVTLIDDGNGTPTLASAFEPKQPPEEEETSGGTAIVIDELSIERCGWRRVARNAARVNRKAGRKLASEQTRVASNPCHPTTGERNALAASDQASGSERGPTNAL
jgi:hypothetical protein